MYIFLSFFNYQNSYVAESVVEELSETNGVVGSGILRCFLKTVDFDIDERNINGIVLSSLLRSLSSNPSVSNNVYIDLKNGNGDWNGLFEIDNNHIQISKRGENGEVSCYELIIADNSDGNGKKKRMAILTAERFESELIGMDCSGMREDVIIDLNRGGCRWEGGELNGKPFGFGREYSEDDNLVYEGFVFEGMKVCFGKEWNDDGNNNCLMYEGGYCNGERCGKGKSYDLTSNVDFEGEWMNNHGINGNGDWNGLFEIDNNHIQISKRGENGEFSNYELIIAEYSDGKKRMAILTAESLDSELVEMDCSGMRENVIIDLNREGRHWEGGELNGKPFGFGYE